MTSHMSVQDSRGFFLHVTVCLLQCDRLKRLHAELEEKLEASEIQIKQQSADYRTLLHQRDVRSSSHAADVSVEPGVGGGV